MTQQRATTWAPPAPRLERRAGRIGRIGRVAFWVLVVLAAALLSASIAIPILTIQPYTDQSPTMENTIHSGEQMFVVTGSGIRRGDVVVLRVPLRISRTDDIFVKRVIGLPGDHVACCDARGRVTVNGKPLDETYLYPGDRPSVADFSVTLRRGQIWVMGDRRNISLDSRRWGPVPESGVLGRVVLVERGSSFVALRTPRTFVADGLAPADTRPGFYVRLVIAAVTSVAALLILTVFGTARFVTGRRRARREEEEAERSRREAARRLVEPMWGVHRVPPPRPGGPGETTEPAAPPRDRPPVA
jgi:signal peptidase I